MKSVKKSDIIFSRIRMARRVLGRARFTETTAHHWTIDLPDGKLDYWPAKRGWVFQGIQYVGDPSSLAKFLSDNGGGPWS